MRHKEHFRGMLREENCIKISLGGIDIGFSLAAGGQNRAIRSHYPGG